MGKIKTAPQAASEHADSSWSTAAALQLNETVRQDLSQKFLKFVSFSAESYEHPSTYETIQYDKIVTFKPASVYKKRPTHYYACHGPHHICQYTSVYNDLDKLINHLNRQHQPPTVCPVCGGSFTHGQYQSHYSTCMRITADRTKTARSQQTEDIDQETEALQAEQNDEQEGINVILQENQLVDETADSYIPITRSRRVDTCTYSTPLLVTETLQYFDLTQPVDEDSDAVYKEWTPTSCGRGDDCNVIQHGTFVRFCYDTSEVFLVEIKRFKCTTHFTRKDRRNTAVTFNMLNDCVDTQMNTHLTIRKTHDVVAFDTVLMTARLWTHIANATLVTLNDSHVNTMLKHTYRRQWQRKLQLHLDHKRMGDPYHTCSQACYGLTMTQAAQWVNLYTTITQRALDIKTTRAIYQKHIFPTAVLPLHSQLQHELITVHCSNAIAMDHTFRMARFGTYNEHVKDSVAVAVAEAANGVMNSGDAVDSGGTASTPKPGTLKRAYNQSVYFNKTDAQLLTVTDSNGYALCSYIVPSGKIQYPLRCLQQLVTMQYEAQKPVLIDTVSVDNASQTGPQFKAHYTMITHRALTVLQDLWHARERIEREFDFGHPLIREARSAWRQLLDDVVRGRYTVDVWQKKMEEYRDKYSKPVKYSAVGEMHIVSQIAFSLLADDPAGQARVLTGEQMVERYSRAHPDDIDDSNQTVQAVLRQPGVTALNNLISDANIGYVFDRTQAHCVNTKGTTPNEALHRIYNGRLSRFGGIRTFASCQQGIIVIQYQYNSQKHHNTSQYWCEIGSLPLHNIRQQYAVPLAYPEKDLLQRLEIEWSSASKWSPTHTTTLKKLLISLSTGESYCHTKSLTQWLSRQEGMEGIRQSVVTKKLREMQAALSSSTDAPPPSVTSSSSAVV